MSEFLEDGNLADEGQGEPEGSENVSAVESADELKAQLEELKRERDMYKGLADGYQSYRQPEAPKTEAVTQTPELDGDPVSAWNEIVNKETPKQYAARIQREAIEAAQSAAREVIQQTQSTQNVRQTFNRAYPEFAEYEDEYVSAAAASVLRYRPDLGGKPGELIKAVGDEMRKKFGGAVNKGNIKKVPAETDPTPPRKVRVSEGEEDDVPLTPEEEYRLSKASFTPFFKTQKGRESFETIKPD